MYEGRTCFHQNQNTFVWLQRLIAIIWISRFSIRHTFFCFVEIFSKHVPRKPDDVIISRKNMFLSFPFLTWTKDFDYEFRSVSNGSIFEYISYKKNLLRNHFPFISCLPWNSFFSFCSLCRVEEKCIWYKTSFTFSHLFSWYEIFDRVISTSLLSMSQHSITTRDDDNNSFWSISNFYHWFVEFILFSGGVFSIQRRLPVSLPTATKGPGIFSRTIVKRKKVLEAPCGDWTGFIFIPISACIMPTIVPMNSRARACLKRTELHYNRHYSVKAISVETKGFCEENVLPLMSTSILLLCTRIYYSWTSH